VIYDQNFGTRTTTSILNFGRRKRKKQRKFKGREQTKRTKYYMRVFRREERIGGKNMTERKIKICQSFL